MSKLRILCLHGFTSNGNVHAHQLKSLTSRLSSHFVFIFPDGPHAVDVTRSLGNNATATAWSEYVSANSSSGHRAWWFAKDPKPERNEPGGFSGLEKSLDVIGEVMEKEGPVHAIWGFSQGACFAGMLVALLSEQSRGHELRSRLPHSQGTPSAGIFFSGFRARFPQYDGVYVHGIQVPTLHVLGRKDVIVSTERSESLMEVCQEPGLLKHTGGHDIPSSEEDEQVIIQFLLDNVRQKREESL
jgi:predicted esterase